MSEVEHCASCGDSNEDANLGWSEAREDLVCTRCVAFLANHGYYPDEEGEEQSVTVTYELEEASD